MLIAGHGRVAAGAKLQLTSIPVIVARGWSEEEKQAYRLADNELAARASWDPDLLRSELRDLKFNGFALELIGFEPDRLEDILAGLRSSGLTDPDRSADDSGVLGQCRWATEPSAVSCSSAGRRPLRWNRPGRGMFSQEPGRVACCRSSSDGSFRGRTLANVSDSTTKTRSGVGCRRRIRQREDKN